MLICSNLQEESSEEIKPLTEEEKKQKLEELRAAMAIKRAAKSKQDAEDTKQVGRGLLCVFTLSVHHYLQNEAIRRKAGRDQGSIKEDVRVRLAASPFAQFTCISVQLKLKEAEKEAAQRKK